MVPVLHAGTPHRVSLPGFERSHPPAGVRPHQTSQRRVHGERRTGRGSAGWLEERWIFLYQIASAGQKKTPLLEPKDRGSKSKAPSGSAPSAPHNRIILSKSQPRTGHTRRYYPYLHSCELTLHTAPEFIGKDPALRYVM